MNTQKNIKRLMITLIIIVLIICTFSVFCYFYTQHTGMKRFVYYEYSTNQEKVDYTLVPGAGTKGGAPSPILQSHLKRAVQLYAKGLTDKILLSGEKSEAEAMKKYLAIFDIPDSKIWIDEGGVDTYTSIKRAKNFFGKESMYFCTLPQYAGRAGYILDSLGIDGTVVNSNLMVYSRDLKSYAREYFAATKAFVEAGVLDSFTAGSANTSYTANADIPDIFSMSSLNIEESTEQELRYDPQILLSEGLGGKALMNNSSKDNNNYNTHAAIKYARDHIYKRNPDYPDFENNCTNFVSQCLVAGGMNMERSSTPSTDKYISYDDDGWYCQSTFYESQSPPNFALSTSFIRTDSFVEYWTVHKEKKSHIFDNSFAGRKEMRSQIKEGDIFIIYDNNEDISHIGLISNISADDALYCGNTFDRADYSTSGINNSLYPKFGIINL